MEISGGALSLQDFEKVCFFSLSRGLHEVRQESPHACCLEPVQPELVGQQQGRREASRVERGGK